MGKATALTIRMIVITTRSSISVKPARAARARQTPPSLARAAGPARCHHTGAMHMPLSSRSASG